MTRFTSNFLLVFLISFVVGIVAGILWKSIEVGASFIILVLFISKILDLVFCRGECLDTSDETGPEISGKNHATLDINQDESKMSKTSALN